MLPNNHWHESKRLHACNSTGKKSDLGRIQFQISSQVKSSNSFDRNTRKTTRQYCAEDTITIIFTSCFVLMLQIVLFFAFNHLP